MPTEHSAPLAAEQPQDRLAELTAAAQREHLAVGHALGNALQHAMAAGDALLAVRELVPAGSGRRIGASIRTSASGRRRSISVSPNVARISRRRALRVH